MYFLTIFQLISQIAVAQNLQEFKFVQEYKVHDNGIKARDVVHDDTFSIRTKLNVAEDYLDPDPESKETIETFARMAAIGYFKPGKVDKAPWEPVPGYNRVKHNIYCNLNSSFGWGNKGLRGHVFISTDESFIVVSFKGTTLGLSKKWDSDKYQDNLMFSCCCSKVDITWKPMCPCVKGEKVCSLNCLKWWAHSDETYYHAAIKIVENVRINYPSSKIWFTGHSMGGSIASLLAATYEKSAAITFNAPGEKKFAEILNLNPNPNVFHFGVSTDPIFNGACQGKLSPCYAAGYAMETKCHLGKVCVYAKSGKFDILHHQIKYFYDHFISKNIVPKCYIESDCKDCSGWAFE
ncbi:alpha/beta-hydrolase [Rozella allomycis CSF55]|uniref:triacylglycerol lipase n=1 Tax=Rozella allomycis (strain CSF55) TaxID=988480 RepID=A0A075AP67_ROZAC|nr:hypothetical protein O9G_000300 [Rozella allomycis CSF55]RKP18156.1 alpha/beta-hydrolase [Rozella allomycis CSF55]|eukprot:EPZ31821.1 hypothetical protein O9G_000300 [Rozella allomycis CSF55]